MAAKPPITIGLTVFLLKDGKLLLGKRRNAVGAGEYSFPGGHLEYGENFEECIKRELSEEIGDDLKFKDLKILCVTNSIKYKPIHHVAITFEANWASGEPYNNEPEKNEGWDWYKLEELPKPLFPLVSLALEAHNGGATIHSMY